MPTIHLSVPDRVYRELREAADVYGIQVTDLIKVFIRNNIEYAKKGKLHSSPSSSSEIEELKEHQSLLDRKIEEYKGMAEKQLKILMKMIAAIEDRLASLELEVEELKDKVEGEAPIIEPELLDR